MGCLQQWSEPRSDRLKPSIVETHQNTLVVLFLRPAGGWRWVSVGGVWIKGSRVLFHYPIDADLPPSQCSPLLKICFSVSLLFSVSVLFSHGSCRDQLWVWPGWVGGWVGGGIIVLLQTEEKVWYWYSSVGVRRWGSDFCSSAAVEILL